MKFKPGKYIKQKHFRSSGGCYRNAQFLVDIDIACESFRTIEPRVYMSGPNWCARFGPDYELLSWKYCFLI